MCVIIPILPVQFLTSNFYDLKYLICYALCQKLDVHITFSHFSNSECVRGLLKVGIDGTNSKFHSTSACTPFIFIPWPEALCKENPIEAFRNKARFLKLTSDFMYSTVLLFI